MPKHVLLSGSWGAAGGLGSWPAGDGGVPQSARQYRFNLEVDSQEKDWL